MVERYLLHEPGGVNLPARRIVDRGVDRVPMLPQQVRVRTIAILKLGEIFPRTKVLRNLGAGELDGPPQLDAEVAGAASLDNLLSLLPLEVEAVVLGPVVLGGVGQQELELRGAGQVLHRADGPGEEQQCEDDPLTHPRHSPTSYNNTGGTATVYPISFDPWPFYIVSYCIKMFKTSWTYSIINFHRIQV